MTSELIKTFVMLANAAAGFGSALGSAARLVAAGTFLTLCV